MPTYDNSFLTMFEQKISHYHRWSSSLDFLGIVIVNSGFLPTFFLLRKSARWIVSISIGARNSDGSLFFVREGGSFIVAPPGATGLQNRYCRIIHYLS